MALSAYQFFYSTQILWRIAVKSKGIILIVMILFTLCLTLGPSGILAASDGKTLKILNSYKCASIDPAKGGSHWLFDWAATDTFMKVTENGDTVPNVLKSLDRLDSLRWKLTLRKGIRFQNGKELNAKAAAAAIQRQLDKSKRAQLLLGGSKIEITGPLELIIETPSPNASVPNALAARNASLFVYEAEVMEAANGDMSKIVGAGAFTAPYEIVSYNPEYFKLKRNNDYWAGTPALEQIEIQVVPDEQARIKAVQSGEADLAFYPPFEAAFTLKHKKNAYFKVSEKALQSLLIYINLRKPPFDNVNIRKAFSMGIDYREIAEDVSEGIFAEAKGIYPYDLPYAVKNQHFDPEKAKQLLDQEGWKPGKNGIRYKNGKPLTASILFNPRGPEVKTVSIAIQNQLSKIGMDIKLDVREDARAFQKENLLGWDSSIGLTGSLSGTGDYVQPFIRRFTTKGDWNFGGINDQRIDEIAEKLQTTLDVSKQYELLDQAQKILVDEQVYILSSTFKKFMVVTSPEWKNYQVSSYRRHITWETAP